MIRYIWFPIKNYTIKKKNTQTSCKKNQPFFKVNTSHPFFPNLRQKQNKNKAQIIREKEIKISISLIKSTVKSTSCSQYFDIKWENAIVFNMAAYIQIMHKVSSLQPF